MRRPKQRRPGFRPGMRRRPLRRPGPPGTRRAIWTPPPPELEAARDDVARAHELMASGDYRAACDLFSRVAALAAGHQHFRRAGQLYAQAAHAALEAGNLTQATAYADRTIDALVKGQDFPHAVRLVSRMEEELRARGYEAEAQTLRQKFDARLAELGIDPGSVRAPVAPEVKRQLPAQCEACLGPVRSDEVEWIDDASAVCAYCGSVLQAT